MWLVGFRTSADQWPIARRSRTRYWYKSSGSNAGRVIVANNHQQWRNYLCLCVLAISLTTFASESSSKWTIFLSWLSNIKMPTDLTLSILPRTLYQHNGVSTYQFIVLGHGSFYVGIHFLASAVSVFLHSFFGYICIEIKWFDKHFALLRRYVSTARPFTCFAKPGAIWFTCRHKKIKIVTTETKFVHQIQGGEEGVMMQYNDSSDRFHYVRETL